jgi:hypothetical protein
MASTYTANSGIQLPANGEQSGTWGETINDNMDIIDRLTNGVGAISLSGTTHTLTITDGTLSEGQYNVLVLGGSPSGTNTITITPNDGQHVYIVKNSSGQSAIFTQGSGGDITLLNGQTKVIYSDGVGAGSAVVDITNDFAMGNVTITGGAISGATLSTSSFTLGGVAITATGTEINILDGVTATAAEINILDGVTATAAEINILDGVTATAAEINILDGVTATAAELNYNDITTLGTVQASKTVTADASGDVLFPDNAKAIFGAGSDLQIYHSGSDSIISEAGTGILSIRASAGTYIQKYDGTETMAFFGHDDGVYLYYDNAEKLATTATGVTVTGTVAATAYTGDGSALTGVGGSTTYGAVGTYTRGRPANATNFAFGDTGSGIYPWEEISTFPIYYDTTSGTPFKGSGAVGSIQSGTWRCMSMAAGVGDNGYMGLWVRIS